MSKLKFPKDTKEIFKRELLDFLCWHENNRNERGHLVLSPIVDEYIEFISKESLPCKEAEYELCPVCLGEKQLNNDELGWLPCAGCYGEGWIKIKR